MIIEFIGQPASGKTFIAEKLYKMLEDDGYSVYSPEFEHAKLNRFQKCLSLLFWLFKFSFDKNNRQALKLIRKNKPVFRRRIYYYKQFFLFTAFLQKAFQQSKKKQIIILSEGIVNLCGYVCRSANTTQDNFNIFYSVINKHRSKNPEDIVYIKIDVDFEQILCSKLKRLRREGANIDEQRVISDIRENEQIFEKLLTYYPIKKKFVRYKNCFTNEVSGIINIKDLIIKRINVPDKETKTVLSNNIDSILFNKRFQFKIKRIFDFTFSFIGLLMLLPLLIIICVFIKVDSKGPILFKQIRVGRNGKEFKILKFRTMIMDVAKTETQLTVGNDSRITNLGRFLRKLKLDEIPQLINVLIGDMSLVGPRPEVPQYVALYDNEQKNVLRVRPGITDIASIYFKDENNLLANEIDPVNAYIHKIMPYKLNLNKQYLNRFSLLYDLKIIVTTLFVIISRKQTVLVLNVFKKVDLT